MSNAVISVLASTISQYDLLSTVNFALTGATTTQMDGTTLTDGMKVVLSNNTTNSQCGSYSCAVSGGNYTLTLIQAMNNSTATLPILFQVIGGSANAGTWLFVNNGSTGTYSKTTIPILTNNSIVFWNNGLSQNNSKFVWDNTNNYLGIGTSTPAYPLDVNATTSYISSTSANTTGYFNACNSGGGSAIANNTSIGQYRFMGRSTSSAFLTGAYIEAVATENWGSSNYGAKLNFVVGVNGGGGAKTPLVLDQDGSATFSGKVNLNGTVGLGTSAYRGIALSSAQQWIVGTVAVNSYFTMTSGGYVQNNQNNITINTSGLKFTLGVGVFRLTAFLAAVSTSVGWCKFLFTNYLGTPIGASNRGGFTQNVGTGSAANWCTNQPASCVVTVTSGTTDIYLYCPATGGTPAIGAGSDTNSYIDIQQIG